MVACGAASAESEEEASEGFDKPKIENEKIQGNNPFPLSSAERPWLGYLKGNVSDPKISCSGFLIRSGVIMTAAHCVMGKRVSGSSATSFAVDGLVWGTRAEADSIQEHHSKCLRAYILPEAAQQTNDQWSDANNYLPFAAFDVAIVAIDDLFGIPLGYILGNSTNYDGREVMIGGYGQDNDGNSGRKLGGKGFFASGADPGLYRWTPQGNEWQAKGDSGSPVLFEYAPFIYYVPTINVVGVTLKYDIFTQRYNYGPDLAKYRSWIAASAIQAQGEAVANLFEDLSLD